MVKSHPETSASRRPLLASWNPDILADCWHWYCLRCDITTRRAVDLFFQNNNVLVKIPTEIGNLTNLRVPNMTGEFLGQMRNLTYLNLSFNKLTGSIPRSPTWGTSTLAVTNSPARSQRPSSPSRGLSEDGDPESEPGQEPSLLDLPELTLECVLENLSLTGLCSMSAVCSSLRERCRSDHLWEKHVEQKWAGVIGNVACAEWDRWIFEESRRRTDGSQTRKGLRDLVSSFQGVSWIQKKLGNVMKRPGDNPLPPDSVMALYLSLESGKFWFPARVYNRENGHSGFMLPCYDAHICYNSPTDTFQARYSSQGGRRVVEESVPWNRIRPPPVSTPPYELHVSDCLNDLKPGDHIEIQWRKSKEFPYGWWYGVVGHLESCSGSEDCCHCSYSDAVTLEFNHYPADSRWRNKVVNRKKHPEADYQVTGFYGGIRKLDSVEEITGGRASGLPGFPMNSTKQPG